MSTLAAKGRFGDTAIAHLTPGEIIIPRDMQTPELIGNLSNLYNSHGTSLARYQVGNEEQSINPETGHPEYFSFKKALGFALPIALSFIAPGIGTALGSSLSAGALGAIGGGLGGFAGSAINGGSFGQDLLGGATGAAGGYFSNGGSLSSLFPETSAAISSGLSDAGNSISNGFSSLFDIPSSTGSGLSGDFSAGFGGAPTLDSGVDAARSALGDTSAIPSASSLGATPGTGLGATGGGSSGGFFSAPAGNSITDQFSRGILDPDASSAIGSGLSDGADGFTSTLSTGGSNVATAASGGNNYQLYNNLLRGGLGSLLDNTNSKGYDAQINAGNQIQGDYQPFLNSGTQANNALTDLYGLNGQDAGAQAAAQANFQNTPGYQFALGQGVAAQDASAAARGNILSGNQQKALTDYGQGLANTTYNQYVQNLQNQVGKGVDAAGGVGTGQTAVANAQMGKSGAAANNQNQTLAGILSALFPQNGSGGGGSGYQGILQQMFG